ncbi:MAG: PhoU domain-containing protein, partial [Acidiferrobacterales bacterium]
QAAAELKPKYLDETLLSTASLALSSVRLEIGRLGERVQLMFDKIFSAALSGDEQELQAVVEMDEDVDSLHGHIVMFLGKLSMTKLSAREADELMDLIQAVNYLEHIGDIIQNNMKTLGMRRIEERIVVSERTMRILKKYHEQVAKALDDTVKAVANDDAEAAVRVRAMRKDIAHLTKDVARHEIERLMAHEPNRLKTYIREVEIIEHMDQIFEICRDVARIETPELPALEPEEVS